MNKLGEIKEKYFSWFLGKNRKFFSSSFHPPFLVSYECRGILLLQTLFSIDITQTGNRRILLFTVNITGVVNRRISLFAVDITLAGNRMILLFAVDITKPGRKRIICCSYYRSWDQKSITKE